MTAAQEAWDALQTLPDTCARAGRDLVAFRRAALPSGSGGDAEFAALHVQLAALARAVGALPRRVTGLAPDVPWRELERLPALLARPDIRRDRVILDITLTRWLRELERISGAMKARAAYDPDLLALDADD